jgi:hypothetical protein
MLDDPPVTTFNVTQSFALFSAILLWTKNRLWIAGNRGLARQWEKQADYRAHSAREALRKTLITEEPWLLSRRTPQVVLGELEEHPLRQRRINSDFDETTAEEFVKWLRDALAHGDGRSIRPLHKRSARTGKTLLAGFKIVFNEHKGSRKKLTLKLFHDDMQRIGIILADQFCLALSRGRPYFEIDALEVREPVPDVRAMISFDSLAVPTQ